MSLLIPGTNSIKDTGYDVANSLRFESGDSAYLSKTFTSTADSQKKFTASVWVKRSKLGAVDSHQDVFSAFRSSDGFQIDIVRFQNTDQLQFFSFTDDGGSAGTCQLTTNRLFRDVSAWYNIVVQADTSQSTASDRVKIYVNGVEETSFASSSYPPQNSTFVPLMIQSGTSHQIGAVGNSNHLSAYLAEVVYLDNQYLDHTSFGEFDEDSNVWKPKDVSDLTFGANGFYLDFEDSSNLGNDVSGNNHDFTSNNLAATDQTTDTCTNNFATLNPLDNAQAVTFSLAEGNLELNDNGSADNDMGLRATMGVLSGKWYYEQKQHETSGTVGLAGSDTRLVFDFENQTSAFHRLVGSNGSGSSIVYWSNGTFVNSSALQGWAAGDIIGVALDMDNGKLFFSINGVFKGFDNNTADPVNGTNANFTDIPTDGTGGFAMPYIGKRGSGSPQASINFGNPSFSISSGNTDGEGFGNFEYAPPTGFHAWCSKNLAEYG